MHLQKKFVSSVFSFYATTCEMNRATRIVPSDLTNQKQLLLGRKMNRRLSVQNNQLNNDWKKVRESLDRIRGFAETKMVRDKREMLNYQEKLKRSSGNFDGSEISTVNTPRGRAKSFSVAQDEALKHTWLERSDKSRQRRPFVSGDNQIQSSTISSEKKRVFRRRASLSLLELQKINGVGSNPLNSQVSDILKTSLNSLEEEPSNRRESIFDLAEGEQVEPIRIPPSVRFPPIHQLQPTKLSTRNFEKDADFERKKSGELNYTEELKYCRYIRNARRKSVA